MCVFAVGASARVCVCVFVTDLGMDEDDEEPVPLPNVNGAIMKKVIPHQNPHFYHPPFLGYFPLL